MIEAIPMEIDLNFMQIFHSLTSVQHTVSLSSIFTSERKIFSLTRLRKIARKVEK